jgi:TnpA family transposase
LQLSIEDATVWQRYAGSKTQRRHTEEIKQQYGYLDFHHSPLPFGLLRRLYARVWLGPERPIVLFNFAVSWLIEHKILLPGITVLERLVAQVRDRANRRLWQRLASLPNTTQKENLRGLLKIETDKRQSALDRLRRAPTRISSAAMVRALQRLEEVREIGVGDLDLSHLPTGRVRALARYAMVAWAKTLAELQDDRKIATLLAFAHELEAIVQDDAIDLLDQLTNEKFKLAVKAGQQERLQTLADFDLATDYLREACLILLDEELPDAEVRQAIFEQVPRQELLEATDLLGQAPYPHAPHYYNKLSDSYLTLRRLLPLLLKTINFEGVKASQALLDAWDFLRQLDHQKPKPNLQAAPTDLIEAHAWHEVIFDETGQIDRRYYSFFLLQQLRESLRRRDVYVTPSRRWYDPRLKLLQGQAWQAARPQVCQALGLSPQADDEIAKLTQQLDQAYQATLKNFSTNQAISFKEKDEKERLSLSRLDKQDEPESLVNLRQQVNDLLPVVDLPEILLEIQRLTGFADEFSHISEARSRIDDLPTTLCAVLLAEAGNIGLEPLIQPNVPALTRSRLQWAQQNYIRAETLTRANARLVDAQTQISLAQQWGGGEVASADGQRFVVPIRTLNAAPNPKYFGVRRGVTLFSFTSDQYTSFYHVVIPGAVREALYILDGLLEQQTSLKPIEVMTDTASYTDVIFGLFWLLGYQFSPRLADIGKTRFWRIDPQADYGPLNVVSANRIKTGFIADNWDDSLRVAGSLKLGTVTASELMRTLQANRRPSTLAKAIGEIGRIAKTLYLLRYIDDEAYRRRILIQLNRGEGRHRLARAVFFGRKGEVRQRYREGQEDQLGALGLVVNVIVLWNTLYIDKSLGSVDISLG